MEQRASELVSEGLLTVAKASTFTGLSRTKLYDLMLAGDLPYVKINKSRRIPVRAVKELAARNLKGGDETIPGGRS